MDGKFVEIRKALFRANDPGHAVNVYAAKLAWRHGNGGRIAILKIQRRSVVRYFLVACNPDDAVLTFEYRTKHRRVIGRAAANESIRRRVVEIGA